MLQDHITTESIFWVFLYQAVDEGNRVFREMFRILDVCLLHLRLIPIVHL